MINITLLTESLAMFHVKLSKKQIAQFNKYYELLIEWNERMNLTAITDPDEVVIKHFVDSLSILQFTDLDNEIGRIFDGVSSLYNSGGIKHEKPQNVVSLDSKVTASSNKPNADKDSDECKDLNGILKKDTLSSVQSGARGEAAGLKKYAPPSIIDVGTGAGFPGIPLKIACPEIKVTLLDSLQKRVGFLDEVIDRLGLENIEAVHGRAEDLAHDNKYREQYDVCVSRAVANLSTLTELCLPFVKVGGVFAPYKSEKIAEELPDAKRAMKLLGCGEYSMHDFYLPNSTIRRTILVVKKAGRSANQYPRKAGTPAKKPL